MLKRSGWIRALGLFGLVTLTTLPALPAAAQAFPTRPVHWVVPFSAGGPADLLVRAIAPKLSDELGVPVVVENRLGAGGSIALDYVAKATADGHIIGLGLTGTQMINPYLTTKSPYDPLRDFSPITPLVSYTNVLLVHSELPVKTVGELVAYARSNPTRASFASGGIGTSNHLSGELFRALTGTQLVHIPYKGNAQAIVDVGSGSVSMMFDILATGLAHAKKGYVRPIAVTSSKRSRYAPDVPTMAEAGIDGFKSAGIDLWMGAFAPPRTPKAIVDRLYTALDKAMRTPEVTDRVSKLHYEIWTMKPDEFSTYLETSYRKWGEVMKLAGVKAQ